MALSSLPSLRGSLPSPQTDFVWKGLGSLQRGSPCLGGRTIPPPPWLGGIMAARDPAPLSPVLHGWNPSRPERGFPSFRKGHTPLLWRGSVSSRAPSCQCGLSGDCLCVCMCVCMLEAQGSVQLFATLWMAAFQVPLSMGFSRQEDWNGLPFPFLGGSSQPRDGNCYAAREALLISTFIKKLRFYTGKNQQP